MSKGYEIKVHDGGRRMKIEHPASTVVFFIDLTDDERIEMASLLIPEIGRCERIKLWRHDDGVREQVWQQFDGRHTFGPGFEVADAILIDDDPERPAPDGEVSP